MLRTLAAILLSLLAPVAATAQTGLALPTGLESVTLIEGWRQPDGSHLAAVEIRMAPGWYTYWRVPGEAGIPPQFDWSGSGNLAAVRYEWPRPLVFESYGIPTIGYRDALVLPVLLRPERPGAPIEASLDLFFGVCNDICVPAAARLDAELAADAAPAGRARIEAALARRAHSAAEAGIDRVECIIAPRDDGFDLTAEVRFAAPPAPGQVAVIEAGDPALWIAPPQSHTEGRRLIARTHAEALTHGAWLDRGRLRVTLLDATRMVEIRGCPAPS